jgi:shikimate kinase
MNSLVRRKDRIYLTGFMGSGKSTIGPILANTIGYDFVDVDRRIEEKTGKTVSEIFLESGEVHFRGLERELLSELSSVPRLVISLGGGTAVDPQTFRFITTSGILIYLKTTPEQIYRRLHFKNDRPMLTDAAGQRLGEEQLRERIQALFLLREPVYARADITIHTDGKKVGITVDEIVRRLSTILE